MICTNVGIKDKPTEPEPCVRLMVPLRRKSLSASVILKVEVSKTNNQCSVTPRVFAVKSSRTSGLEVFNPEIEVNAMSTDPPVTCPLVLVRVPVQLVSRTELDPAPHPADPVAPLALATGRNVANTTSTTRP